MPALHQFDYIFAITTVFAALVAWSIGANDVANSFATAVSARSLTLKQALALASACEFSGSVTVGSSVIDVTRTKIINPDPYDRAPAVLLLAMMSTMTASSIFLTIATRYGMPVSTTHSVVGGLVGSAMASIGPENVNWGFTGVPGVIATWIITPGLAGVLGAILFVFTKMTVLDSQSAVRRAFYSIPLYTFITVGALTMLVVWGGIHTVELSAQSIVLSVFAAALGVATLEGVFVLPYLWLRIMREDWTLRWYHVFLGPYLLRRPPPPPPPLGVPKVQIQDFYRDHLTADELQCVRASETLLQSVQTENGEPPSVDKENDLILPLSPQSPSTPGGICRSCQSEHFIPPRPPGKWTSPRVIVWKASRLLLRGVEKDVTRTRNRNAVLKWDIQDMHSRAARFDNRAEYMYSALQILTAAAASFTHGANDVSNAMGPFAAAYQVWSSGNVPKTTNIPLWALFFGGGAMVVGLLTYGYHVIRSLGNRLTLISPSRGFCMELASTITVLVSTRLRLPVSTTQCITGAIVGVGLANGDWKSINPKLVGWIYLGWMITVPATGLIAGCIMALMLNAPEWPRDT